MGEDSRVISPVRALAVLGLAVAITTGFAAGSQAAPSDRASDPVVMKGSALPSLRGAAPKRIVAFRWRKGHWRQVPVQVDERHVVSARTLYPKDLYSPTYVTVRTFDIEVYADPNTRSGPDENRSFDRNDELVFMAGDTGARAPARARRPAGMTGAATRLKVTDPDGGGSAFIYLFRSRGRVDQSAGRDYVDYRFHLNGLAKGQKVRDFYHYQNSPNPENSSVTTRSYRLHSADRWIEDEIRIDAGGADGEDILDREAVSGGGLNGCGRSEFTMSGNWDKDINPANDRPADSDEGTYLVIKDGPVRAIRSYMGANSGPYVERDHFYYADLEATAVYLRVHPLPDLFVWTDLSDKADGMTYRDEKNPDGVTVDGVRDTLNPFTDSDFENGRSVWQQVSGPQGTMTTLTSTNNDLKTVTGMPVPSFTSYYLDASDPGNGQELQCGGDLKAYGAHGFGVTGIVPNTDPVLAPIGLYRLELNRTRYFDAPGGAAAEGENLKRRVNQPLTASPVKIRMKGAAR